MSDAVAEDVTVPVTSSDPAGDEGGAGMDEETIGALVDRARAEGVSLTDDGFQDGEAQ